MYLFGDETLTEVDVEALCPRDYAGRVFIELDASLPPACRPATRGEVAQRIVREILPPEVTGCQDKPKTGADLCDAAKAFYETHHTASEEDLAVLFLPGPSGYLRQSAADFLLKTARTRRIPALEEFLVSDRRHPDESPSRWTEMAASQRANLFNRYAALRGAEVQPFAARFAVWLLGTADAYEKPSHVSYGSAEEDRKHVEGVRAKIRKAAADIEALRLDMTLDELLTRQREQRPGYRRIQVMRPCRPKAVQH